LFDNREPPGQARPIGEGMSNLVMPEWFCILQTLNGRRCSVLRADAGG
jgi:hypothetical protein